MTPHLIPIPCGRCGQTLVAVARNNVLCSRCDKPEIQRILKPQIEAMPGTAMVRLWNTARPGTHPFFHGPLGLIGAFKRRLRKLHLTQRLVYLD